MIASYPDRRFQLWEYRVSHGALLFRSPRGPDASQNVDLIFDGVEFLACPRLLRGLELESPNSADLDTLAKAIDPVSAPNDVFVLVSAGVRHLVVASSLRVVEHDGDIFDSPFS